MQMLSATLLMSTGLLLAGVRYVPEDTALTIRRFGRYTRTLLPGLRFTLPLLDQVTRKVRLVGHRLVVPVDGHSTAKVNVYYQILAPERAGGALEDIDALVNRFVHQTMPAIADTASDAASDASDDFGPRLKSELNRQLEGLGLRVTRCELRRESTR